MTDRHAPGKQYHVRLPMELVTQLEAQAKREDRAATNLIVRAVRLYLLERKA